MGLKLEAMTVQNVSLPEELQKIMDQKIGMGMVGNDMGKFMQYQTGAGYSRRWPRAAVVAAVAVWPATPWGWVRAWPGPGAGAEPAVRPARRESQAAGAPRLPAVIKPDDVMATLEKLGELKAKGILTQEEFDAKKTELLKKLV